MNEVPEKLIRFIKSTLEIEDGTTCDLYSEWGKYRIQKESGDLIVSRVQNDYSNLKRNLLRHEEWDFPKFIMEGSLSEGVMKNWEGRAALEYELTRELFYHPEVDGNDLISDIEKAVDILIREYGILFTLEAKIINWEKVDHAESIRALYFQRMHSYIQHEHFPGTPWFALPANWKCSYIHDYFQYQTAIVPLRNKAVIDITWSEDKLLKYIKEYKEISLVLRKYTHWEENDELFPSNSSGNNRQNPNQNLQQLGRYRIVKHFGCDSKAHKYWGDQQDEGASPAMDEKSFKWKALQSFYKKRMSQYVEDSPFISQLSNIRSIFFKQ